MRILMTTDTIGGVWTFTQELAAGLLEHENDVLLVSFGRAPAAAQLAQCELLEQRFGRRFRYVAADVPLEWMEQNERVFEDGAYILGREAAVFAPEMVHTNQFCYGALDGCIPRVVTAHSDVLSWAKACRREPLEPTAWLQRYVEQVQAGLSTADAVVAPTQWMMNAAADSFALPKRRVVIPNGRSIRADFGHPRVLRAVTAGRLWDEAKGISILAEVKTAVPVVIAGDSGLNSAQGRGDVVSAHSLGQLDEQQMVQLLQQSALYLCLSLYEPFGLAPLEAALCGCAVIARDIPSLREVWDDAALFFKNAEELSAVLERLSRDAKFLEAARRRSFERSQDFSRERMVDRYCSLFQDVHREQMRSANVA